MFKFRNPFKKKQVDPRVRKGLETRFANKEQPKRVKSLSPGSRTYLRENLKTKKESKFKIPSLRKKRILFFLLGLGVLGGLITGSYYLVFKSDYFEVKNINVIGTEIDKTALEEGLAGRNLFALRTSSIVDLVHSKYINVDEVYARKILPNKIEVDITFNNPKIVIFNESSYVVLNQDDKVIGLKDFDKKLELADFELDILAGKKNLDLPKIKQQYKDSLTTEEEKQNFKWEDVGIEKKKELLAPIEAETFAKFEAYIAASSELLKSEYPDLFQIFMFKTQLDPISSFDYGRIEFSDAILAHVKSLNLEIASVRWSTKNNLNIALKDGKVLIFAESSIRTLEEQVRDFNAVFYSGVFNDYRIFDLRTKNFSLSR